MADVLFEQIEEEVSIGDDEGKRVINNCISDMEKVEMVLLWLLNQKDLTNLGVRDELV